MFLFSNKFLSFLLVMVVAFGGEDHSVKGDVTLKECWRCTGGDGAFPPTCNAEHKGGSIDCFHPHGVCGMEKVDGKIIKKCEGELSKWSDNGQIDGNPLCIKNEKCYCFNADNCNKDINFGLDGGTGTGGGTGGGGATTDNSGAIGTKDMFPAGSIIFWMMATVAVALASCIGIPTK